MSKNFDEKKNETFVSDLDFGFKLFLLDYVHICWVSTSKSFQIHSMHCKYNCNTSKTSQIQYGKLCRYFKKDERLDLSYQKHMQIYFQTLGYPTFNVFSQVRNSMMNWVIILQQRPGFSVFMLQSVTAVLGAKFQDISLAYHTDRLGLNKVKSRIFKL